MVDRIDRRSDRVGIRGAKGRSGAAKTTAAPAGAVRGAGAEAGPIDRFARLGRVIGGAGPSQLISSHPPGERVMMPLTEWEIKNIIHDPLLREARKRMLAYRDLPECWRKKVDAWGERVNDEMKYSLAKAIMKG